MSISRGNAARIRVNLLSAPLSAAIRAMINRQDLVPLIISNSILQHQITRASIPLMETAFREAERLIDQPVCKQLLPYLRHHIEEEMYHDEWALQDLESIGIDRAMVLASIPAGNVAALVGAQYYWVQHHHPVAILGYMIVLESNVPSDALMKDLQMRTGLPKTFFRSYQIHATLDLDHQAELFQLLNDLPLELAHEKLINKSILHTVRMLADTLANPHLWDSAGAAQTCKYNEIGPLSTRFGSMISMR
jgi:Iron-containing redox enzyme